jgi:hypothetical protein
MRSESSHNEIQQHGAEVPPMRALRGASLTPSSGDGLQGEVAISTIANGLTGALLRRFDVDPSLYGVILSGLTATLHRLHRLANVSALTFDPLKALLSRSSHATAASTAPVVITGEPASLLTRLMRRMPWLRRALAHRHTTILAIVLVGCFVFEWRAQIVRRAFLTWCRPQVRMPAALPTKSINLFDSALIQKFIEYQNLRAADGVFDAPSELNFGHPEALVTSAAATAKSDRLSKLLASRGTVYSSVGQKVAFRDTVSGQKVSGRFSWEHHEVTLEGALLPSPGAPGDQDDGGATTQPSKKKSKSKQRLLEDDEVEQTVVAEGARATANKRQVQFVAQLPSRVVSLPFLRIDIDGACGITNVQYWKHVDTAVRNERERANVIDLRYARVASFETVRYSMYAGENHSYAKLEADLVDSFFQQQRHLIWGLIKAVDRTPEVFFGRGQIPRFSCVLYGPPGSGKSTFAYRIARALKRHLVAIDLLGVTSYTQLEQILRRPVADTRSDDGSPKDVVFFFDEIDIALLQMLDAEDAEAARLERSKARASVRAKRLREGPSTPPPVASSAPTPSPGAPVQVTHADVAQQQQQQQIATAQLSLLVADLSHSLRVQNQTNPDIAAKTSKSGARSLVTDDAPSGSDSDAQPSRRAKPSKVRSSPSKESKKAPSVRCEQLLELIQGPVPLEGAILVATTNKFEEMNARFPRLFRPGRFEPVYFGYVDDVVLCDMVVHFFPREVPRRELLRVRVDPTHTVSSAQLVQWAMFTAVAGGLTAFCEFVHRATDLIRIKLLQA